MSSQVKGWSVWNVSRVQGRSGKYDKKKDINPTI